MGPKELLKPVLKPVTDYSFRNSGHLFESATTLARLCQANFTQ